MVFFLLCRWDMGDHQNDGAITACDGKSIVAMIGENQKVEAGGKIALFYGNRPSMQFLIYQGFVVAENEHDFVNIRVGLHELEILANVTPTMKKIRTLLIGKMFEKETGRAVPSGTDVSSVSIEIRVNADGSCSGTFLRYCRIAVLDNKDDAGVALRDRDFTLESYGDTNQRRALKTAADLLASRLAAAHLAIGRCTDDGDETQPTTTTHPQRLGLEIYKRHRAILSRAECSFRHRLDEIQK